MIFSLLCLEKISFNELEASCGGDDNYLIRPALPGSLSQIEESSQSDKYEI